jgi:endonuclease/exonuclease/phosphatase family metal-dependent hydrolase
MVSRGPRVVNGGSGAQNQGVRSLRIVTLNMWNDRPDAVRRLNVAVEGLKALKPDVVAMQEVVETPAIGNQAQRVADALGASWAFDPVDRQRAAGPLGNAVVSRFPIVTRESLLLPGPPEDPRRALLCVLETPFGKLPMVSVHLSWEMWHSPRREQQVVGLDAFVRANPGELPPILAGDFNATPDSACIQFLTGKCGLDGKGTYYRDAWARRHPHADGYTWSDRNPYAVRWVERNRRLDYIFIGQMHPSGWGAVLDCRLVLDLPGPDGEYASDHFGVYAEIGEAPPDKAV